MTQSVSVMTAEDIQALGGTSLAEVARFIPGLAIEGTGREGALTAMFSRGGESDYNLVLIDGVRAQPGRRSVRLQPYCRRRDRSQWKSCAGRSRRCGDRMRSGPWCRCSPSAPACPTRRSVTGSFEGGSFDTFRGDMQLTGGALQQVDYQAAASRIARPMVRSRTFCRRTTAFEQGAFDGGVGARLGDRAEPADEPAVQQRTGAKRRADYLRLTGYRWHLRHEGGVVDRGDRPCRGTLHRLGLVQLLLLPQRVIRYFRGRAVFDLHHPDRHPDALFPNGTRLVRLIDSRRVQFARRGRSASGARSVPRVPCESSDFPFTSSRELRRPAVRYQGDFAWATGQRLSAGYEWERERNPLVDEQDFFRTTRSSCNNSSVSPIDGS